MYFDLIYTYICTMYIYILTIKTEGGLHNAPFSSNSIPISFGHFTMLKKYYIRVVVFLGLVAKWRRNSQKLKGSQGGVVIHINFRVARWRRDSPALSILQSYYAWIPPGGILSKNPDLCIDSS